MEHTLLRAEGDTIQLELRADDAIKAERFPYDFVLTSTFRLDGKTVHHTLQVTNPGTEELRFRHRLPPGVQCPVRCHSIPPRTTSSVLTGRKARSSSMPAPTAC
ncbi:MAG: hypothetical protein ACLVJH_02645 [Faecalibacterium prausnitzii]